MKSTLFAWAFALSWAAGGLGARADMMQDSPVKFPERGPLPARFPPDVKTESFPAEKAASRSPTAAKTAKVPRAFGNPEQFGVNCREWVLVGQ
jgi:hypothetical protein